MLNLLYSIGSYLTLSLSVDFIFDINGGIKILFKVLEIYIKMVVCITSKANVMIKINLVDLLFFSGLDYLII